MNVNFDSKRFESIAVPTALATVAGGAVGYALPKMVDKQGKISDTFVTYVAGGLNNNDISLMKKADSLDKINPFVTDEDVVKLKGERKKVLAFAKKKMERANAALEKFVAKNAEVLGVKPSEGQTLKDAVRSYLQGKNAADVKEAFLPQSMRNLMEQSDYVEAVRDEFSQVFDSSAKKFKKGEAFEESAKFFKKAAKNMKLMAAGWLALLTGGVALISSAIASKIANK